MLGAIIGDIVGSVYEFRNHRSKTFEPFFHRQASYTDDTVCTIAVADALVNDRHPAEALKDWGRRYWENGGWGQRFASWLSSDDMDPYNSYGNGAAMRVAPAGLLANSVEEVAALSSRVTEVTHNHPEGMKGAEATALAIFLARRRVTAQNIKVAVAERFSYDLDRTPDDIRPTYRFNETCQETVPQALVCALTATSYEDAIRNAISIGGDSDTVAAIAGGVAEALFGIPDDLASKGWFCLPKEMREVLIALYREAGVLGSAPCGMAEGIRGGRGADGLGDSINVQTRPPEACQAETSTAEGGLLFATWLLCARICRVSHSRWPDYGTFGAQVPPGCTDHPVFWQQPGRQI